MLLVGEHRVCLKRLVINHAHTPHSHGRLLSTNYLYEINESRASTAEATREGNCK